MRRSVRTIGILAATACLVATALYTIAPQHASAQQRSITVFAAASLSEALNDVIDAFAEQYGINVTVSYAGTSALARQIERGAPADIFISADVAWMDHLEALGLIDADRRTNITGNRLVLVAPMTSARFEPLDVAALLQTELGPGRLLAMADAEAVPAGRYGKAALQSLGVWENVSPYVVQTDNVRAALAFVARGETPFGIVYATDAAVTPDVTILTTFPSDLHPPILYPAALLHTASASAETFFRFLTTPEAAAIFQAHGFLIPEGL